jgi:hypothetical protein
MFTVPARLQVDGGKKSKVPRKLMPPGTSLGRSP